MYNLNFADAPTEQMDGDYELMPAGTLAFAIVGFRGDYTEPTVSKNNPNNAYLDINLTIVGGPYDKRKVFDMIGVKGENNTYVNQGRAAIRAMLEVGRGASEQNQSAYQIASYADLAGLKVAIKLKVEKGTSGYSDKNRVAMYLSPNEHSSGYKDFQKLLAGESHDGRSRAPESPAPQATGAQARTPWQGNGTKEGTAGQGSPPAPAPAPGTQAPSWLR